MASKSKNFIDDGWAFWVDGDDVTTIYFNDWVNPKGNSYIDMSIRIRGIKKAKSMNLFVPFSLEQNEMIDLSEYLKNENIFRVTFNSPAVVDFKKNKYTSEAAYNGKTIDIIHFPIEKFEFKTLSKGTLVRCEFKDILEFIDNDEAYFFFRIPHKSIDDVFKSRKNVKTAMSHLRELITSPVISESYIYQIRINDARMLPQEINKIGGFHRERLKKSVVSMSIAEDYEVSDHNCYRVRRLEEEMYDEFAPEGFKLDNSINYLWQEEISEDEKGSFNFYLNISRNKIGRASMFVYMVLLIVVGLFGNLLWDALKEIFNIFE